MWFSLFTSILICAVVFYQGLQGLFSSVINCVLTILSAALAFGLYENLYQSFLLGSLPDHGRAIALLGIFIVSVLVLRTLSDILITGNQQFPVYVDRIGGGTFGLITAMIIVGMMAIGFQALPFPTKFLGFQRYTLATATDRAIVMPTDESAKAAADDGPDEGMWRHVANWKGSKAERHSLLLAPDSLTVALVSHLSDFALANPGGNRLGDIHPDFLADLHHARDGVYRESLATVGKDALTIKPGCRYLTPADVVYEQNVVKGTGRAMEARTKISDRKPEPGFRWLSIPVEVRETRDRAGDKDRIHFVPDQVRLYGKMGSTGRIKLYSLAGISDYPPSEHRLVLLSRGQDIQRVVQGGAVRMTFLFEVPEDESFKPWMITYKMNVRKEILASHFAGEDDKDSPSVSPGEEDDEKGATADKPKDDRRDSGTSGRSPVNPKGRVHALSVANKPRFSDELPFEKPLRQYSSGEIDFAGRGVLASGKNILAQLDDDWEPLSGSEQSIERFEVPDNMRMMQVDTNATRPGSMLGRALNFAVASLRNFHLKDASGGEYRPVGVYAMAEVNGQRYFELLYLNKEERIGGRLPELSKLKTKDLEGDYAYVLLFHVPPGKKVESFSTGRKSTDLKRFNLVAPD